MARDAEAEGLDQVFRAAGRMEGARLLHVSAMNPDRLEGRQISASSSNRNFGGVGISQRQNPLMSPAMAGAAAVHGHVIDVRRLSVNPVKA